MSSFEPWLLTRNGNAVNFANPNPDAIDLHDIAYHLARQRRFNGATEANCSVALHSVIASYLVPPCYEKEAFLHDAAEAYIGDIPGPLKWMIHDAIAPIENNILQVIFDKFGLRKIYRGRAAVLAADLACLKFERENFLPPSKDWEILEGVEYPVPADNWLGYYDMQDPKIHERLFLDRAGELGLR